MERSRDVVSAARTDGEDAKCPGPGRAHRHRVSVLRWAASRLALATPIDNRPLLAILRDTELLTPEDAAALTAAYFAYRKRLHALALAERPALVGERELAAERARVGHCFRSKPPGVRFSSSLRICARIPRTSRRSSAPSRTRVRVSLRSEEKRSTAWLLARHGPRPHRGLMLPGPGVARLILAVGREAAHEEPRGTARAQAGIDVEDLAGRGHGGEQMDDTLRQAGVALLQDGRPLVKEYEVEVEP